MSKIAGLDVSTDLFVSLLKSMQSGPPRYFEVVENPLPNDAEIVRVMSDWDYPHIVRLLLRSESFSEVPEGQEPPILPPPFMRTVYLDVPTEQK